VDVCGDLVAQHFPREANDKVYEKPEELAVLAGANWVSQYLASNPEVVITAQPVAAESSQQEELVEARVDVRQTLAATVGAADVSSVHTTEHQTTARARQLAAWRLKARNPDDQPDTWLSSDTLAGIRIMPLDRGVFLEVHNAYDDPELHGDQEPKGTDALRDAGAGAPSTSVKHEEKHYVKAFTARADVARYFNIVQPVLPDGRVTTKIRMDHTKRRILLGRKKAGSTRSPPSAGSGRSSRRSRTR